MRAGRLRHRVAIQTPVDAQNTRGEVERAYPTVAVVRASVEPLSGRELLEAQQIESRVTCRVRMRYADGVTSHSRILLLGPDGDPAHPTRTLNVLSVIDREQRHIELELMCEDVT